jgi:hypothetical protein
MNSKLLIALVTVLFSCNNQKTTVNNENTSLKVKHSITNSKLDSAVTTNTIKFNLEDFKTINGYKGIDLNLKELSFDQYLLPINSQEYELDHSENVNTVNSNVKFFTVKTNYGGVKFESIEEGDLFLEFHLDTLSVLNYKIINVYTSDNQLTIFLNTMKFTGFRTNGNFYLSKDKKYFISVSNTPDYCLLEIYKINKNSIVNMVNLYSFKCQIDSMRWSKYLLIKTITSKNSTNYYRIDWIKILNNFDYEN